MPALTADLKRAVVEMPEKEKDKLLIRLISKDPILTEKLDYELVEGKTTLDHRRQLIRDLTNRTAKLDPDTAGWLMMDMRTVSGYITRHVKVTKDTYGDVDLTLHMLTAFLDNHANLLKTLNGRTEKCAQYVAKRTDMLLKKLNKLDPDYFMEFEDDVNRLLRHMHTGALAHFAKMLALPKTWGG
ncbi:hypothetical protein J2I47_12275 [Fibrella sp. HMF5335]|uniref:Uncharacterized protein n=1 Tax=Fibrella rubiginis TaxID=2817060 RepID=A0A939GE67_9BACT|nr:hypothetical protein [Fibrella rubiginis]MBO0937324.1 hypothetical protein [Fibrella rubiginis]